MTRLDLSVIAEEWLQQCGSCDAGLAMPCTHPTGDPRTIISRLADEVLRLRIRVAEMEDAALDQKETLRAIARAAVLSAHTGKHQRNIETIDRIRDMARKGLSSDSGFEDKP